MTNEKDDELIRTVLRPIRGCATDSQYVDVFDRATTALATVRREERETAFKEAIAIIVGQPTAHYIYSGAYPMATDTFRDNAVKAIEATIAIERARAENRKGEG